MSYGNRITKSTVWKRPKSFEIQEPLFFNTIPLMTSIPPNNNKFKKKKTKDKWCKWILIGTLFYGHVKTVGGRWSTPQRCFECFASSGVQSTAILHIKGRNELVLFALQQSRNDAHADIFIYCNEKQLFNFYPFPYWLSVKRIVTGLCRWLLTRLNRMMKQKKKTQSGTSPWNIVGFG